MDPATSISPSTVSNSSSWTAEFIFHGTGCSGSVPNIECITAPKQEPCRTCHLAMTPQGRKTNRRNTGAIIRVKRDNGSSMTIVIDIGKNFRDSALEWFPKYGLRKIDAVLLTHAHADAINGLDDLRSWTHGGAVQSHIDIYTSKETFLHVQRAFPYLISSEFASGGGDVPTFKWHVIEPNKSFFIEDVEVYSFNVQHGLIFSKTHSMYNNTLLTPDSSQTTTPRSDSPPLNPQPDNKKAFNTDNNNNNTTQPFFSMGFVLLNIVYMSDVSDIPEYTWDLIQSLKKKTKNERFTAFIVDCLKLTPHTSHFGIAQAVAAAQRVGAERTYMVGFTHRLLHEEWEKLGEYFGEDEDEDEDENEEERRRASGEAKKSFDWSWADDDVRELVEGIPREPRIWIRPAYDGLQFEFNGKGII